MGLLPERGRGLRTDGPFVARRDCNVALDGAGVPVGSAARPRAQCLRRLRVRPDRAGARGGVPGVRGGSAAVTRAVRIRVWRIMLRSTAGLATLLVLLAVASIVRG